MNSIIIARVTCSMVHQMCNCRAIATNDRSTEGYTHSKQLHDSSHNNRERERERKAQANSLTANHTQSLIAERPSRKTEASANSMCN